MTIFKEFYEVIGAAKKRAQEFEVERVAALDEQWKIVKAFGAEGFRPGGSSNHGGCYIKSLLFLPNIEPPAGLRKVGRDKGCIEYRPSRNTKAGKAIAATLEATTRVMGWGTFANTFGWKGRSPMGMEGGRGIIYFCSGTHVKHPKERFFLQYPRELKDGWKPPEGLKLIRESDVLRAVEDHNAAIKK